MLGGAPVAHGTSVPRTDRLISALTECIRRFAPRTVVETGTFLGQGSTRHIIEAFGPRPPEVLYTIEVSPQFYAQAQRNLIQFPFVHCLWGLSVGSEQAEHFIRTDPLFKDSADRPPIHIDSDDPVEFYLAEIRGVLSSQDPVATPPDGWLAQLLPLVRGRRPLVALDSAGGIGWLEFQEVMRLLEGAPFALFLDDVNHVKHYRSYEFVRTDPRFHMFDSDFDQGWAIAAFDPAWLPVADGGRST